MTDSWDTTLDLDRERRKAELMAACRNPLIAAARRITRDQDDAEDAVQDAFLDLMPQLGRFDDAHARSWLIVATKHRALDRLRRRLMRERADLRPATPDAADRPELDASVKQAILTLTPRERDVLIERTWRNRSFREIANRIGIAEGTARTYYARAIDALRRRLAGTRNEDR